MTVRRRMRRGPWFVAAVVGAASVGYLVRALPAERWGGGTPGIWDLMVAVVAEPRFLVVVCFTTMLTASVLRREAVMPELIRIGSWRAYLAQEGVAAVRGILPSVLAVVIVCLVGAALAGLPWRSLHAPASTAETLARAGLPGPLGVLAQLALATLALTVLHLVMTALRIATGSIGPVIAAAVALFSWSSVSLLSLVTTITVAPTSGRTVSAVDGLGAGVIASLNTITYLHLPTAIEAGLPVIAAGLGLSTGLAFVIATALDLRVERARHRRMRAALQHAH